MEFLEGINWIAVITGTVVAFLAGWLWYGPKLFGPKWAEGSGVEMGTADSMPMGAMASQVLALFLLAMVVGVTETSGAIETAILAILAVAVFAYSMGSFSGKNNYALMVDVGYIIVSGVIMIGAQAIF